MKVLLISSTGTPYVSQLRDYVKKYHNDVQFSLLTIDIQKEFYEKNLSLKEGERIFTYHYDRFYRGLLRTIQNLPDFDIVHFLWIEWQYGLFLPTLKKKCKKIFVSVGGSDLYRDSKRFHVKYFQKKIIRLADWISSENIQTKDYFYQIYGKKCTKASHSTIRFGVDVLDGIDEYRQMKKNIGELRDKWGIPKDKLVVALGHNGRREHQHLAMIDALSKLNKEYQERLFLLIPMTYLVPGEEYVEELRQTLKNTGLPYLILRDFMNMKEMAESVMVCDMMIHVQTSDQLSSTMLAHMYQGNIVIAGSWLPYGTLIEAGVKFYRVDEVNQITEAMETILESYEENRLQCELNMQIIHEMSSWEKMASLWYEVYRVLGY